MITAQNLINILSVSSVTANNWVDPLNAACSKYGIVSPLRIAAFIAQIAHESANLSAVQENLNYRGVRLLQVFPKYFDAGNVDAYAGNPVKIGNRIYANRMGNGDEASGEGFKYHGRGLIQITGKYNYISISNDTGTDYVGNPDLLAQPAAAAMSAAWFWYKQGLNALADTRQFSNITQRINGGQNGAADRLALYAKARAEFGC